MEQSRECVDCGLNQVCSVKEVELVFYDLDDYATEAVERTKNNPYKNHICTACWTPQVWP